MSADLAILVPMLGRPHRIAPLLASIREATPDAHVLFLVTPTDVQVRQELARQHCHHLAVPRRPTGDYARKINTGYRATTQPYLFTAADDLRFHPGWFEAALAQITPQVGVVGTNDLGSPRVMSGQHATHSLVTRWYADLGTIDQPHAIYHEGYVHEYVDDELVGTAKKRGAWAFAESAHVEHLHPDWGKAPTDAMYAKQRGRMRASRNLYNQRRRLWM